MIGCGSTAIHSHLPEYASNRNIEIVAVCDIIKERAEEAAKEYGGTMYTNYEALLADKRIDVISVCLPNYLHASVSIAALNKGKHVFVKSQYQHQ